MAGETAREPGPALAVLLALQDARPAMSFRMALAFLMVCENDNLIQRDLAFLMGENDWNVSRTIHALANGDDATPALITVRTTRGGKRLSLTEAGGRLKKDIESAISVAAAQARRDDVQRQGCREGGPYGK